MTRGSFTFSCRKCPYTLHLIDLKDIDPPLLRCPNDNSLLRRPRHVSRHALQDALRPLVIPSP